MGLKLLRFLGSRPSFFEERYNGIKLEMWESGARGKDGDDDVSEQWGKGSETGFGKCRGDISCKYF